MVSNSRSLLRHVQLQRFGLNGEVDTRLLVLVHVVLQLGLAQLVKRDDDQSHEDVDEEEREDDEKHDVENGHFHSEPRDGPLTVVRRRHRVL